MREITGWTFTYEEAENICLRQEPSITDFNYGSCEDIWVTVERDGTKTDVPMISLLREEHPKIPPYSICFYAEGCQIFPARGNDIFVIAGIGEYE